eukprot:7026238-Prymnesium_polylepis.1
MRVWDAAELAEGRLLAERVHTHPVACAEAAEPHNAARQLCAARVRGGEAAVVCEPVLGDRRPLESPP